MIYNVKALQTVPLLTLLVGVVAGVLLQRYVGLDLIAWLSVGLTFATCLLRRYAAVLLFTGIGLGWASSASAVPYSFSRLPDEGTYYCGTVEETYSTTRSTRLTVSVDGRLCADSLPALGHIPDSIIGVSRFNAYVYIPSDVSVPEPGRNVLFSGTFSYPGERQSLPAMQDNIDYNYINSISLECFSELDEFRDIGDGGGLKAAFLRLRQSVADRISASGVSEPTSIMLRAFLTGDCTDINSSVRDNFARAGVAHLLALSGLHVGVLTLILALIFYPLSLFGLYKWRWGLTMIFLWLFAMMTGCSPSVVRAVIMASVVIGAVILDRPRSSMNALCLAAALILLFDPHSLYRAGFQLTFLATASIILCSGRLTPQSVGNRSIRWIVGSVTVTMAATVATLPLVAWMFHRIPLYFLPANIFAGILMPPLLVCGVLLGFFGVGGVLASAADFIYGLLADIVQWFSMLGGASVEQVYFDAWKLIPAYACVVAIFCTLLLKGRRAGVISLTVAALCMAVCFFVSDSKYPENEIFITGDSRRTSILCHNGNTLDVCIISQPKLTDSDSIEFVALYRDFIGRRAIDTLSFVQIRPQETSVAVRTVSGRRIAVAGKDALAADSMAEKIDYLLVVSAFRGNVAALAEKCGADTVVLSADISKRRHLRMKRELEACGRPVRSLRDGFMTIAEPL